MFDGGGQGGDPEFDETAMRPATPNPALFPTINAVSCFLCLCSVNRTISLAYPDLCCWGRSNDMSWLNRRRGDVGQQQPVPLDGSLLCVNESHDSKCQEYTGKRR